MLPADCAPDNGDVHPAAIELCGNSTDDNCSHAPGDPAGDMGDCPPLLRPHEIVPDANGTWVNNEFFHVWFSPVTGWAPRELFPVVNGGGDRNVILLGDAEQSIGSLLGPSTSNVSPAVPASPTVLASGPAVYRLRVQWSAGPADTLSGETIYTVTPDGRIHMHQSLTVGSAATSDSLATHITLNPDRFTHANWSWNPGSPVALTDYPGGLWIPTSGDTSAEQGYTCLYDTPSSAAVGMSWRATPASSAGGPRIIRTSLDGDHLALRFDWFRDEPVLPGTYSGQFMMFVGYMEGTPCEAVALHSQAFRLPPTLVLADGATAVSEPTSAGAFFPIRAADGSESVSLTIDTDAGKLSSLYTSLFRIDNFPHRYTPVVWRDGALLEHGVDYLYQSDGNTPTGTSWLFVKRPLSDGVTLTLRAPGK